MGRTPSPPYLSKRLKKTNLYHTAIAEGAVAKYLVTACAALLFAASGVNAKPAAGFGVSSCSDIIDLYEPSGQNGRDFLLLGVGEWAFGYMTGLNMRADEIDRRDLSGFHSMGIGGEILGYCYEDRDATIMDIVTALYFAAPKIAANVS